MYVLTSQNSLIFYICTLAHRLLQPQRHSGIFLGSSTYEQEAAR